MQNDFDGKNTFNISVRGLVEFLERSGDIDTSRGSGDSISAMQKGAALHRRIQSSTGSDYHSEVTLKHSVDFGDYVLQIEGRADGIIISDDSVTIDEIKGVYRDVLKMKEPDRVHLSQARCYAYIYAVQNDMDAINVRMTYGSLDKDRNIRYFDYSYTFEEISEWFSALMNECKRWCDFVYNWHTTRDDSIPRLTFPFEYRPGQKKLASDVYTSIARAKRLFIEAPCGTGKTISTIFPAVKAVGEKCCERIFYLTAKTAARSVAVNTFRLLMDGGLRFKTVELTAKDKLCPYDTRRCNPDECEYAKGHYDRINDVLYDIINERDLFERDVISAKADEGKVCPFELSLDISSFCDAIIGDYNYVFDPNVALQRFFGERVTKGNVFLVDEAHNLVDRAREMYSALLYKEDFLRIKKSFKSYNGGIPKALDKCNRIMLGWKKECEKYLVLSDIDEFVGAVTNVVVALERFFEKRIERDDIEEVWEFYFALKHFLNMSDCLDSRYTIYCDFDEDDRFFIKLLCIDPSRQLSLREDYAVSTVFFSATLLPIDYYKSLLSTDTSPYAIYAPSFFDPAKRHVIIGRDVSSAYRRRNEEEYDRFARYVADITTQKSGNYMVFGPSYAFLENVYKRMSGHIIKGKMIIQRPDMTEQEREEFLDSFNDTDPDNSIIGFCVMGGVFSEGIDLVGEKLIGAICLGVGLPMVTHERQLIREHFGRKDGFSYAYIYPGMNKVLQAAGRVIRTEDDVGVVALLDERFLKDEYSRIFPMEWTDISRVTQPVVAADIKGFWDSLG